MREPNEKLAADGRTISLEVLLDTQVAMLAKAQQLLSFELSQYSQGHAPPDKLIRQLESASKAVSSAVASKIALTKRLKEIAGSMTPTELDDAAIERIKDMPFPYRSKVLMALSKHHTSESKPNTKGAGFAANKSAILALQEANDDAEVDNGE